MKISSRCGDAAVRGIDRKRSRSGKLRSGEEMRGKARRLQDVFIKLSTRLIYQRPLSPMLGLGIRNGGLSLGCLRLEISQHKPSGMSEESEWSELSDTLAV